MCFHGHKNIILSFLNSVLSRREGEKIVDILINDPANQKETIFSKFSIVDVRCTDEKNNQYIIFRHKFKYRFTDYIAEF